MLRWKKTAILLVLMILVNTVCFAASFSDIEGTNCEQAVEALSGLGIMKGYSDGTFKPDANITRAEFSAMIIRILGFDEESLDKTVSVFEDVSTEHWACGIINALAANGAVSGYDDKNFGPDDNITLEQALKVIVEVLGYGPLAKSRGGYPGGYIAIANDMGLLSKTNGTSFTEAASRGVVANVLYAATDVQIYVQNSFGGNDISFEKRGTVLEEYMGIITYKGRVVENYFTSLTGTGSMAEDQIRLRQKNGTEVILKTGETNAIDLFGYNVIAYAKESKDDLNELLFLMKDPKGTNELVLKADQIEAFGGGELTYYKDPLEKDKELKAKVLRGADVIYNGVAYPEYTDADMLIKTGDMTLIDTDNDSAYDLILVNEFKTVVANKYVSVNTTLVDKYSASRNVLFDEEDTLNYNKFYKFDTEMSISVLNEWDVVAVYQSKNTSGVKVSKLYASNDEVSGTIESLTDEAVTINGQTYQISEEYKQYQDKIGNLVLGNNTTILLDRDGKVTGIKKGTTSAYQYAYVIGAESEDLLETVTLKLYTQEGILDVYEVKCKIELDGQTGVSGMKAIEALQNAKNVSAGGDISQMVRLKINEAGIITAIDTTLPNSANVDDQLTMVMDATSQAYRNDSKSFEGKFILTENSVIFSIPNDLSKTESYGVKTYTDVTNGSYDIKAFNVNSKGEIGAVALFGDIKAEMDNDVAWSVLLKKTQVASDDGDIVDKMYFFNAKNQSEYEVTTSERSGYYSFLAADNKVLTYEDIHPGDICRVAINPEDNTLQLLEQIFDVQKRNETSGELKIQGQENGNYADMLRIVRGWAVSLGTTTSLVRIHNPAGDHSALKEVFWNFEKSKFVYVEEKQPGQFRARTGTINDIIDIESAGEEKATYLVAKSRYAAMQEVFIYKFYEE